MDSAIWDFARWLSGVARLNDREAQGFVTVLRELPAMYTAYDAGLKIPVPLLRRESVVPLWTTSEVSFSGSCVLEPRDIQKLERLLRETLAGGRWTDFFARLSHVVPEVEVIRGGENILDVVSEDFRAGLERRFREGAPIQSSAGEWLASVSTAGVVLALRLIPLPAVSGCPPIALAYFTRADDADLAGAMARLAVGS
jgi:hypothetical protein